eukprot:CAMPEP_0174244504 /NCGR_PEP_ID=MMETSP0417-20130205/35432_1 /TAXON_ID=242541 /ORGANISM="Mayorella sp, Strain BSH-02190019" /LENGTH=269 /DNA_ID=CAMNT_0015324191 /DNA_START=74 /DNA_END=880 /DNA_ORIENTATION=+
MDTEQPQVSTVSVTETSSASGNDAESLNRQHRTPLTDTPPSFANDHQPLARSPRMDVEHADASVGKEKTIKRTLIDEEQVWADAESRAELKYPDASEAERQALANADAVESWLRKVNFLLLEKQGLSASQHCQGGEDCSLCASQQCEHPMRTTLIQYTQDHPSPSCMERNSPDKQRAEYLVPLRNPSLPAEPPFGVAVRCGCAVHAQMRALCDHCAQSEQTPSTDRRRGGGGETTTKAAAKSHSQPPLPSPPAGSYRFKHRVPAAELRR